MANKVCTSREVRSTFFYFPCCSSIKGARFLKVILQSSLIVKQRFQKSTHEFTIKLHDPSDQGDPSSKLKGTLHLEKSDTINGEHLKHFKVENYGKTNGQVVLHGKLCWLPF